MARFYGSITGNRGTTVTKPGTATTGLDAHIRGWDFGVCVEASVGLNGRDVFTVHLTGGSNNPSKIKTIGTFVEGNE